jgi:hypothetical protein
VRFGRSILRPFHQLWQLSDVEGNAPSFVAVSSPAAVRRPGSGLYPCAEMFPFFYRSTSETSSFFWR